MYVVHEPPDKTRVAVYFGDNEKRGGKLDVSEIRALAGCLTAAADMAEGRPLPAPLVPAE